MWLVETPGGNPQAIPDFASLPVGAMYYEDPEKTELVVKLPSGTDWNMDRGRVLNAKLGAQKVPQWTRTGEPPNITAYPSINHTGRYHGWLKDGVLSDDIEGRKF